MDLHPDVAVPLVQFERAGITWDPKMPVSAARPTREFAPAYHDKATPLTFRERLLRCQAEGELQDGASILLGTPAPPTHVAGERNRANDLPLALSRE